MGGCCPPQIVITVDIASLVRIFAHSVCRKVTQCGETKMNAATSCQKSNSTKDCLFVCLFVCLALLAARECLIAKTFVYRTHSVFVSIKTFMAVIETDTVTPQQGDNVCSCFGIRSSTRL
jgi:hypothetical protein